METFTAESKVERVSLEDYLAKQNTGAPAGNEIPSGQEATPVTTLVTEAPKTEEKPSFKDEELVKVLNERGISLSKIDDIKLAFEERTNLNKRVEELDALTKKGLEFPNEKAKALYEFAQKFDGNEMAAAKSYLNLAELDANADPKRLQFEDFALKYPHIPRDEARDIFEAQYTEAYGDGSDLSSDPLRKFKHDEATRAAKQNIDSTLKAFREAKLPETQPTGPTPEQLDAINKGIESGLKNLKPTVVLPEYKTKTGQIVPKGAFNVEMSPEEASALKAYAANPETFVKDLVNSHKTESGINWNTYLNDVYQFKNREKVHADIFSQGIERGMAILLNQINNTGKEKVVDDGKETPIARSQSEQYEQSRRPV
jgi:hypothetical protein